MTSKRRAYWLAIRVAQEVCATSLDRQSIPLLRPALPTRRCCCRCGGAWAAPVRIACRRSIARDGAVLRTRCPDGNSGRPDAGPTTVIGRDVKIKPSKPYQGIRSGSPDGDPVRGQRVPGYSAAGGTAEALRRLRTPATSVSSTPSNLRITDHQAYSTSGGKNVCPVRREQAEGQPYINDAVVAIAAAIRRACRHRRENVTSGRRTAACRSTYSIWRQSRRALIEGVQVNQQDPLPARTGSSSSHKRSTPRWKSRRPQVKRKALMEVQRRHRRALPQ
jgi:hypothetical protein